MRKRCDLRKNPNWGVLILTERQFSRPFFYKLFIMSRSFIYKNLFITNKFNAQNPKWLQAHNIKHIVRCRKREIKRRIPGIRYLFLSARDVPSENLSHHFDQVNTFIEEAGDEHVLVHCYAGISRSSTLVIANLLHQKVGTLERCFLHVKMMRPVIKPNYGFMIQLHEYEKKLGQGDSVAFVVACTRIYLKDHIRPVRYIMQGIILIKAYEVAGNLYDAILLCAVDNFLVQRALTSCK